MPATETDYSKIRKYQEEASSLNREGSGVEAAAGTLGDRVMEAVRADRLKRGTSKLATDVGNVMGQMVTDPTGIRERTSGMVDPFSVNALTSDARAQNLRTLGTTATQGQMNQGSIDDVIQAGANRLKAQAQSLYAQAQQKAAEAESLSQEWQRAFQERQQSWNEQMDMAKLNQSGSGGFGSFDFTSLTSTPTEEMPLDSPGKIGATSPHGQWTYTGKGATGWEPTQTGTTGLSDDVLQSMLSTAIATGNKKMLDFASKAITANKAFKPSARQLQSEEDKKKLNGIMSQIEELKKRPSSILETVSYQSKLNILTQRLAKIIEQSRLSDADRAFYLGQMPSTAEILIWPEAAASKINGVIDGLGGKSSSGGWE